MSTQILLSLFEVLKHWQDSQESHCDFEEQEKIQAKQQNSACHKQTNMFLCQTKVQAKLSTVLETIEIHREEMAAEAQTLMEVTPL